MLFLNAFKNDVDKSAEKLENYYRIKKTTPEFFSDRDLESQKIQSSLDNQRFVPLPVSPDNNNLIFHRLTSNKPKDYVFDDSIKTFIITSGR